MGRLAGIQLGALARVTAAAACCLALAHCSGSFSSKEYSPRVVEEGEPVPKGGGMYRVGKPYNINGRLTSRRRIRPTGPKASLPGTVGIFMGG